MDFVFTFATFFIAGLLQGVSGFGSALVAMPLLALYLDVKASVSLCLLSGIVITLAMSGHYLRSIRWRRIRHIAVGAAPGVVAGVLFLARADARLVLGGVGAVLIGFGLFTLFARPNPRPGPPWWAWLAGFTGGAVGAAFSTGGPPVIVYLAFTEPDPDRFRADLSCVFFLMGLCIVTLHAATGLITGLVLQHWLAAAPGILGGMWSGLLMGRRLDGAMFRTVFSVLVVLMGVALLGGQL